jgi:zinc protease
MRYKLLIYIFITVSTTNLAQSQSTTQPSDLPAGTRHGVLANGLTYYVLKTDTTDRQIYLALVDKIGAFHFTEVTQLGIAHFIEHLAFQSTTNFPKGVAQELTNLGLRSGLNFGATTGQSTNYHIQIPSGDSTLLRYGLKALCDFSFGRLYLRDDVERERYAIKNEMDRANTPAFKHILESQYLLLEQNQLYSIRLDEEYSNINNVSAEKLRDFELKWYRPNLQAIVVVGDVDEIDIENKIKSLFSKHPNTSFSQSEIPDLRSMYDVTLSGENKIHAVSRGYEGIALQVVKKRKTIVDQNGDEAAIQIIKLKDELYSQLVNSRVSKVAKRSNLNYSIPVHFIERQGINRLAGIDALTTHVEEANLNRAKEAIQFAMIELRRIQRWGFTEREFMEAKRSIKNTHSENRRLSDSRSTSSALQDHFVSKGKVLVTDTEIYEALLDTISLIAINNMARDWLMEESNTDVLVAMPTQDAANALNRDDIRTWYRHMFTGHITRYKDHALKSPKKVVIPDTSHYAITKLEEIDGMKLMLYNGVTLIIKRLGPPTKELFSGKGVEIRGFRLGGISAYDENDQDAARMALPLILNSGIGGLNQQEFDEWIKEKRSNGSLSFLPYISLSEEGVFGQASLNNAEDLFRLLYLYFTEPQKNKTSFQSLKDNYEALSRSKGFEDSIRRTRDISLSKFSFGSVKKASFRRSFEIYNESFSNVSDFTFVLAGYFDIEEMTKLAVKYLSALQSIKPKRRENGNVKVEYPSLKSDLRVTMVGDSVGNVHIRMLFGGSRAVLEADQLKLELLNEIMKESLFERLREKQGIVYGVSSGLEIARQDGLYMFDINFETSPGYVDKAINSVIDEISSLQEMGFDKSSMTSAKSAVRSRIVSDLESQSYWTQYLLGRIRHNKPLIDSSRDIVLLDEITQNEISEAAKKFLDCRHYSLFKLL